MIKLAKMRARDGKIDLLDGGVAVNILCGAGAIAMLFGEDFPEFAGFDGEDIRVNNRALFLQSHLSVGLRL